MARVTSQKTRQAVLVTGDPLEVGILPEKLQLFNELGQPLMIGVDAGRFETENSVGPILPGAVELDTVELYPSVRLYKIATDRPARVRLYPTESFRLSDISRSIGTRPRGNNGRLLEVVTTSEMLELTLSPVVDLVSNDPDSSIFYATITNLDSVEGDVVITYSYIRTE